MISQAKKDAAKKLGFDIDAIVAAAADAKEVDIAVPEGEILTAAQLATRDGVKIEEGKKLALPEAEQKAFDTVVTMVKNHTGIELKGKRIGDVVKEIKTVLETSTDDKAKALQERNTLLLADKATLTSERDAAKMELKTGQFEMNILSKLPANNMGLSAKESFEVLKLRGYAAESTDAGVIWKKNGVELKDPTTHAPLDGDKAIAHIWSEQNLAPVAAKANGGRGAQQKPLVGASGISNKTQAIAAWEEQNPGIDIASAAGQAFYAGCAKADGFNMFE